MWKLENSLTCLIYSNINCLLIDSRCKGIHSSYWIWFSCQQQSRCSLSGTHCCAPQIRHRSIQYNFLCMFFSPQLIRDCPRRQIARRYCVYKQPRYWNFSKFPRRSRSLEYIRIVAYPSYKQPRTPQRRPWSFLVVFHSGVRTHGAPTTSSNKLGFGENARIGLSSSETSCRPQVSNCAVCLRRSSDSNGEQFKYRTQVEALTHVWYWLLISS